jgi:nucleotide-binding universal stress UspA family protein
MLKIAVTKIVTFSSIIITRLKAMDIELIILGAYVYSQLREKFLGRNTHVTLDYSPVPLLKNH